MRIALLGSTGQLGFELAKVLPQIGQVIFLDRSTADFMHGETLRDTLTGIAPDLVVNAAAYTDVERAEEEEAACFAVNEAGPALLADYCDKTGTILIHYSTDYVFDGAATSPYRESDSPRPINVYGRSKLAGERAITASGAEHLIFRCSWIYSARRKNFVTTMLRLAREKTELRVVDDQIGSPTWARAIAAATLSVLTSVVERRAAGERLGRRSGIYHMAAAGETSWYQFTREILRNDSASVEHSCSTVLPISSQAFGARAARPAYSVMDTTKLHDVFGVAMEPWPAQLRDMMRARDVEEPSLAGRR